MANGLECGAGDGQPAAYMITDMIQGGNMLVCAEHWIALCIDMVTAAGVQLPPAGPADDTGVVSGPPVGDDTPEDGSDVQGATEPLPEKLTPGEVWPHVEHHVKRGRAAAHKRRTQAAHHGDGEEAGPPRGTDVPADFGPPETPPVEQSQ